MKRILSLGCLIAALISPPASAILDTQPNGMSDLWERAQNGGDLYTNMLPGDDDDNDGWTNEQEATAGTNPKSSLAPDGFLRPEVNIIHDVPIDFDENGIAESNADVATVAWPVIAGKIYTLLHSANLAEGSWEVVTKHLSEDNGVRTCHALVTTIDGVPPTDPKMFWRIKIEDVDTDGDELTDAEEYKLSTNPHNAQTIPGIPDLWLATNFTNILLVGGPNAVDPNADPDGDGFTTLQEYQHGTDPNNAHSDTDNIMDGEDADPKDGVINWRRTSEPLFIAVDLPVGDTNGLAFDDLSDNGTVLFTKRVANIPDTRILIDKKLGFNSLPQLPPDLASPIGYFGACAPNLIGDQVLGIKLGDNAQEDCTWEPITRTYTPFTVDWYIDDIRDSRAEFQVERSYDPLTFDNVLRTPQGYLPDSEDSGWGDARIEKNGNIIAEHGYWRYTTESPFYSSKDSMPETSVARSATLIQYEVNPETGLPTLEHIWNLVAGATRLVVSENNGEFVKSELACDGTHRPIGVTSQGWVASASEIWSNGTWKPLTDFFLGDKPSQATLLGILDTGLGVAKIEHEPGQPKIVLLIPVELMSDLNNDGQINAADNPLCDAALESEAEDATKDKGTEFLFHNDQLSNGLWDKEENDPDKPVSATNDDDAEEITIRPGITEGDVWLDHPAIAGLSFYKTRECNSADKVNLTSDSKFSVSSSNPFPNKLFVRADGTIDYPTDNPQMEGDLVLKIKIGSGGSEIEASRMKLTVVKEFGAKKFFHAARDYIIENNTKIYTCNKTCNLANKNRIYRIVAMREESTMIFGLDTYDHVADAPRLKGIDEVKANCDSDVIINNNFCFATNGVPSTDYPYYGGMTNRCNGRLCVARNILRPPSDDTHRPDLGGELGRYVGCTSGEPVIINGQITIPSQFVFATGPIPEGNLATPDQGIGGLTTNYDRQVRQTAENQAIGRGPVTDTGKGIVFTATNYVRSGGAAIQFAADAHKSGVQSLSGGSDSSWELLFLDGGSSVGLVLSNSSGAQKTLIKGRKHDGNMYYINTYLLFKCERPRNP